MFAVVIGTFVHATQTDPCTASFKGHGAIEAGRNHNFSISIREPILLISYKSHETFVKLIGAIVECGNATNDNCSPAIHVHPAVRAMHRRKPVWAIMQFLQVTQCNGPRSVGSHVDTIGDLSAFIVE
jgi:hypothetical protein